MKDNRAAQIINAYLLCVQKLKQIGAKLGSSHKLIEAIVDTNII